MRAASSSLSSASASCLRASYFHNQFGRQIEYVGGHLLPNLVPGLSADQQQQLIRRWGSTTPTTTGWRLIRRRFGRRALKRLSRAASGAMCFCAAAIPISTRWCSARSTATTKRWRAALRRHINGIPIGAISPLKGARPFRRPPHTGFFTATYTQPKFAVQLSRSVREPQRRLNLSGILRRLRRKQPAASQSQSRFGYAKFDLGGTYQLPDGWAFTARRKT